MTCCACTSPAVAKVRDGAFLKPVCSDHAEFYERDGYEVIYN